MLTASSVFELLAAEPRRQILVLLCDSETIEVPDAIMPRGSACREQRSEGGVATGDTMSTRRSTAVELYHTHLPKLASADLIEWDRETDTVSRGPDFECIEPLVCLLVEHDERVPGDFF